MPSKWFILYSLNLRRQSITKHCPFWLPTFSWIHLFMFLGTPSFPPGPHPVSAAFFGYSPNQCPWPCHIPNRFRHCTVTEQLPNRRLLQLLFCWKPFRIKSRFLRAAETLLRGLPGNSFLGLLHGPHLHPIMSSSRGQWSAIPTFFSLSTIKPSSTFAVLNVHACLPLWYSLLVSFFGLWIFFLKEKRVGSNQTKGPKFPTTVICPGSSSMLTVSSYHLLPYHLLTWYFSPVNFLELLFILLFSRCIYL